MKVFQANVERPFKLVGRVPGIEKLVSDVTSSFDLTSPDTLTTEKVFQNTHRLVAVNDSVSRYANGPQRHSTGTRSQELFDMTTEQVSWLQKLYPTSRPFIIQCATLPVGGELLWHIDSFLYHSMSHKVHIPVVTNPRALYEFMDHKTPNGMHFEVGRAYEINNIWMHRSTNHGAAPRSHIIIDMLEEEGFRLLDAGVELIFSYHEGNKKTETEFWL